MKSIETLIKINKRQLDEKRLELVTLAGQKEELFGYSYKMNDELKIEEEFAAKDPAMSITFDSYRRTIKVKQANIKMAVGEIEKSEAKIAYDIADIFAEVKKYEIILQQIVEEERQKEKAAEDKVLDEVATSGFLRKEE